MLSTTEPDTRIELDRLGDRYRCSTLVVLIRLRDLSIVPREAFLDLYRAEVERLLALIDGKPSSGSGNFYYNQPFRIGRTLSRAIIRDTQRGNTSMTEALRLMSFKRTPMFDKYAEQLGER